mmetsp:Transcript_79700/g.174831  ORF Transcript_79700/g.174831 Transcript_79700/m.174831 type:complete len:321 (+) Transcript_79700:102-1064(+)
MLTKLRETCMCSPSRVEEETRRRFDSGRGGSGSRCCLGSLSVSHGSRGHRSLVQDLQVVLLAQEIHLQLGATNPPLGTVHVAKSDALARQAAVSTGGGEADNLVRLRTSNGLVAEGVHLILSNHHLHLHQLSSEALFLNFDQRIASDEVTFVELDEPVQTSLEGIVVLGDVLAEERNGLLEPKGGHGAAAPVGKLGVSLVELLEDVCNLVALAMELQAVLTDEAHANCDDIGSRHPQLSPLECLELGSSKIDRAVQNLRDNLLRLGAVDEEHCAFAGDIFNIDLLVSLELLLHPSQVVQLVARVARDVEVVVRQSHEGQL